MTKVAKGKRKRVYRPKTTTGCLTCKVRRLKCDEARPACLRCISARRICDGYSVSPPNAPSSDFHPCDQSRQAFGFFVRYTRHQFAGFFASPFWERIVLQAAHHEPAIRHALVAIGSLHQERIQHRRCANRFALEQYNLSIQSLLQPIVSHGHQAVDVSLICAVLFTYFENMQGHHAEAGCHIRSGAKLLRETVYRSSDGQSRYEVLESQGSENAYVPLGILVEFFAGLDDGAAAIIRDHESDMYADIVSGTEPLVFSTIEEARSMLEHGRYLFSRGDLSHATTDVLQATDCLMSSFKHALDEFISTHRHSFTPNDEIAIAVLQLHALYTHISLIGYPRSAGSDNFLPQMAEMVRLGEQIVNFISALDSPPTSFCMELGFVIPIYSVASGCQDPAIRRQAISLLRRTSRQEGLWDSQLVAKVCERIIVIEESKGVKLTGVCDLRTSSSLLQLDSTGGRLQYVLEDERSGPIAVTEKVFDY